MNRSAKWIRALFAAVVSQAFALKAFADSTVVDISSREATTSTSTSTVWYTNWWIWAAAVGVFLIVVIALTNRGGRSA
jgi:hypothetical protein